MHGLGAVSEENKFGSSGKWKKFYSEELGDL
jgi:hypothetical protein